MIKKVLVTGGTGFIGRQILQQMTANDSFAFYVLTRQALPDFGNIHYLQGNLQDTAHIAQIMRLYRPQILLHLAWSVAAGDYASSKENYLWLEWSKALADCFVQNGGKKIIGAGTCFEYDLTAKKALKENSPCNPQTLYGQCKLHLCHALQHLPKGCQLTWARIFYPYGPSEPKRKLFSHMIQLWQNNDIFCCRTPNDVLDYIHVIDIAAAFVLLLQLENHTGIINICSSEKLTLKQRLTYLSDYAPHSRIDYAAAQPTTKNILGNNDKLLQLGFRLHYPFAIGAKTYFEKESD